MNWEAYTLSVLRWVLGSSPDCFPIALVCFRVSILRLIATWD